MVLHRYFSISFMQRSWDGDAKSLEYFNVLHSSRVFVIYSISVMSLL
jgi:hypothetical protein